MEVSGGSKTEKDWRRGIGRTTPKPHEYVGVKPLVQTKTKPRKQRSEETLQKGKVVHIQSDKCFGFLSPIATPTHPLPSAAAASDSENTVVKNVDIRFRFGPDAASSTLTGGLMLIKGDVMEYLVTDDNKGSRPRAVFARLSQCEPRTLEALVNYARGLVDSANVDTEIVLRTITKCPVGFLLVLDHPNPSLELMRLTLQLCQVLTRTKDAGLYTSRLKQTFTLFCNSKFMLSEFGLLKFARDLSNERKELLQFFVVQLLEYVPSQLNFIMPILKRMAGCNKPNSSLVGKVGGNLHSLPCEGGGLLLRVLAVLSGVGEDDSSGDVSWSQVSLLPSRRELNTAPMSSKSRSPTLPVVLRKGSYGSPANYIDTYFRLLREDCLAGVRQGIQALRKGTLNVKDMKVWFNVCAVGIHFDRSSPGITIALRIEGQKGKKTRQLASPLGGSLVCVADDGGRFHSPIWGMVGRCEETNASKACICFIEILQDTAGGFRLSEETRGVSEASQCARLMKGVDMVMVESPAYYRAYQPVLTALQHTEPQTIPFKDELVFATWPNEAPEYLSSPTTTFDWSCIFKSKGVFECTEIREGMDVLASFGRKGYTTTLDRSQLKAVELTITNRMALIQGPPGTGKTYVGVKLLQLLLSASTYPRGRPILVITFKNHALDQFLEKCLVFCKGEGSVVRVGGRSKNEQLLKYNLQAHMLRQSEFSSDRVDNHRKMREIQEDLEKSLGSLQKCQQHFDPFLIILQASELQLRQFLAGLRNSTVADSCLGVLNSGGNILGESSQNAYQQSKLQINYIRNSLLLEVRKWMPSKEVLQSVQALFSTTRQVLDVGIHESHGDADHGGDDQKERDEERSKEEDEERNAYENIRQDIKAEDTDNKLGGRTQSDKQASQWMENDFMPISQKDDAVNPTSVDFQLLDTDFSQFDWIAFENPWHLSMEHRAILAHMLWQRSVEEACQQYASVKAQYDVLVHDMDEIIQRQKLSVLRKATIIGMTTTGAAIHQNVLKSLSPAVLFVEEAAEMLEPQVLAVLNPDLQHLILIGDHYQLRPSVESYGLEKWHGFGVSMFERLVEHNKLPYQALNLQCRMREEFVPMLLPMYPTLESHKELVSGIRNQAPVCMARAMHFWSHQFGETPQRSPLNKGEANMVVALARWLVTEGEDAENIKVLAAYNGQVDLLRKLLKVAPETENIEVHTIDRFQGAESPIVIVSLVRSNLEGRIGHLVLRNRMCVAASRARCGLYMCGDHQTLKTSLHWMTLLQYFKGQNALDHAIPLRCPRHPNEPSLYLSSSDAATFEPSSVCKYKCGRIMLCGHVCTKTCHGGSHCQCEVPVIYTFPGCGHSRKKMCSEDEDSLRCNTRISYRFEVCGHLSEQECRNINGPGKRSVRCQFLCGKELQCGHPCSLLCSDDCFGTPCPSCLKIEQEKQRIQKLNHLKAIASKQKELAEEIQRLKDMGDQGIALRELHPHDDTYYMVKDRVEKYVDKQCKMMPMVTEVIKIENLQLQLKFLEAQKDLLSPVEVTDWLFHGPPEDLLKQIVKTGFRSTRRSKAFFFDVNSSRITTLSGDRDTKLLLCEVALGKTLRVRELDEKLNLETLSKKGADSLALAKDYRVGEPAKPEQYVIFKAHQAIPRYIIQYKLVARSRGLELENFGKEQASQANGVSRISLTPKSNFKGDSAEEYHYRMAESQFFRMSSNKERKVTMVECIYNESLRKRFQIKKEELKEKDILYEEKWVFHGTDASAIEKIIAEGFKIGGQGVAIKCGSSYGHGVYTAIDPDISVPYSAKSKMMLLSVAILGHEKEDFNYGGNENILVIKDVSQLLPKYVVHFSSS